MKVDASAPMPIAMIAPVLAMGFVVQAQDPPAPLELGELDPIEIAPLPLP